ncbi:MAG: hypothetical protein K2M43_01790 [Mycoplasmoidaceae bacterium]|nr:hypothetical protein [Mycoplasmoidaceae bacterium]
MLIAFGIFGIINGFCLYSSNYYEELISKKDVVLSKKIVGKMKPESHLVGCTYAYSLFVIIFVIATMIGSFGYIDTIGYGNEQANFATRVCSLFSFVDLMAN